jgi:hypothetical protein
LLCFVYYSLAIKFLSLFSIGGFGTLPSLFSLKVAFCLDRLINKGKLLSLLIYISWFSVYVIIDPVLYSIAGTSDLSILYKLKIDFNVQNGYLPAFF